MPSIAKRQFPFFVTVAVATVFFLVAPDRQHQQEAANQFQSENNQPQYSTYPPPRPGVRPSRCRKLTTNPVASHTTTGRSQLPTLQSLTPLPLQRTQSPKSQTISAPPGLAHYADGRSSRNDKWRSWISRVHARSLFCASRSLLLVEDGGMCTRRRDKGSGNTLAHAPSIA